MASKNALNVSLTEQLCDFVADQVASGRYRTASEVVRAALRALERELQEGAETVATRTVDEGNAFRSTGGSKLRRPRAPAGARAL
jgi:antitoxin ParD1/3/4